MKTLAFSLAVALGVAGAAYATRLPAVRGYSAGPRAIVSQTPPPADWPPNGPPQGTLGARIGSNGGGGARGYMRTTIYSDGHVQWDYIHFPIKWVP